LLHPFGEGLHLRVRVADQADGRQGILDLAGPLRTRNTRELAMQCEDLTSAQPALIAEQLGQVPHAAARSAITGRVTQNPGFAAGGPCEAEQQLDRRRLAAAVGSQETEHLTARHDHRQPGERHFRAVVLRQFQGANGGLVCRRNRHQCTDRATASA
jgi:hypothetical protein